MNNIFLKLKNEPQYKIETLIIENKVLKPSELVKKLLTWGLSRTTDDDYEVLSSITIPGKRYSIPLEFTCDKSTYELLNSNILNEKHKIEELKVSFKNKKYLLEGIIVTYLEVNEDEYSGTLIFDNIKKVTYSHE